MYGGVFKCLTHRGLYLHHNKSKCEKDESEGENALEPAEYETQDPFNDMGHIMLEPTVEINMTEEDSDDVPDLELFGPSVEIDADKKAEPEKVIEEHRPSLIKTFVKVKKKRRRPAENKRVFSSFNFQDLYNFIVKCLKRPTPPPL